MARVQRLLSAFIKLWRIFLNIWIQLMCYVILSLCHYRIRLSILNKFHYYSLLPKTAGGMFCFERIDISLNYAIFSQYIGSYFHHDIIISTILLFI